MVDEVSVSKGGYSVTIYAIQIEDGLQNKLFKITPATGKQNQPNGPKDTKIVDLLRIDRTFRIQGYLTSNTDKSNLINIINGAGTTGGTVTFTFSEGGDSTSYEVFVESCIFTYKSTDEPTSPGDDYAKHELNLTLLKGVTIGG